MPQTRTIASRNAELLPFFEQSVDMLCIASPDGYFRRLNPAWKKTLGWSVRELCAKPFVHFVHPDDRAATRVETQRLKVGRQTIHFENRYRCKQGGYRWLQWNAAYLTDQGAVHAIARDVTAQKQLEEQVIRAVDIEREHMGLELHDGLCQNLAAIAASCATLSRHLAARSKSDAAAAAEITAMVNDATRLARDLAREHTPVHLRRIGLAAALEGLSTNLQRLFHIECTLKYESPTPRLRDDIESHLFRIAQQATSNAVTHGRANRIDLVLRLTPARVLLTVRDDGKGFRAAPRGTQGVGLHTMSYRARSIGATLSVRAVRPRGTLVSCELLEPQRASAGRK